MKEEVGWHCPNCKWAVVWNPEFPTRRIETVVCPKCYSLREPLGILQVVNPVESRTIKEWILPLV